MMQEDHQEPRGALGRCLLAMPDLYQRVDCPLREGEVQRTLLFRVISAPAHFMACWGNKAPYKSEEFHVFSRFICAGYSGAKSKR